jgi:kumamolisin
MARSKDDVELRGSDRAPLKDARQVGDVDPQRQMQVTLTVRRRSSGDDPDALAAIGSKPGQLTREEFAERFGAEPADLKKVEDFARAQGLEVVEASEARRTVVLRGSIGDMSTAFGVDLALYEHPDLGLFRGRVGPVYVPAELADVVEGVFGLDDRPQVRPHIRHLSKDGAEPRAARNAYGPNEVARLYDFPTGSDGAGQTVAIIELGGGYEPEDLVTYFDQLGISPRPEVSSVSVDGAGNVPEGPQGADGEVMLDIEVVGAVAPGAKLVVYFAPNTTAGFLDAITTAVHDAQNGPSVISISWGEAEKGWPPQALRAYDEVFKEAAALGVSVCCAAGDDGSNDEVGDGRAHVDFPAASPWVLACGGTRLESTDAQITNEVVWHEPTGGATGGGVSEFFEPPRYQREAGVPRSANPEHKIGRGVPDVAGDADPVTGYKVRVDGQDTVIGGTSAVAPLYAALIALINQQVASPVGFLNPVLYSEPASTEAFHDIVSGDNGDYEAGPGWDACTGLGSPRGDKIMSALSAASSSGP